MESYNFVLHEMILLN